MRPLRDHLTYANVMATTAFLLATSGTAYAAVSVGSDDIVDNSVKSADLKDGKAVKGADVAADSLTGDDIDELTLHGVPISGYERVYSGDTDIIAGDQAVLGVDCPAGKLAIGGGYWTNAGDVHTFWGYATDEDTYTVAFWNTAGTTRQVGVHAICVDG